MLLKKVNWIIFFISFGIWSQEDALRLSLEECINLAIESNLDLRKAEMRTVASEIHFRQTRNTLFPDLNANVNGGVNNGRSIDPFTNAYIEEQLSYGNAGLSLEATVFNGFRIKNSIQRDRFNLEASEMEKEEAQQNLILEVTLSYLQVLNNQDLVRLAELRMASTFRQLEHIAVLQGQGEGNPADYSDIKGQYAIDRAGLVSAQQALKESVLRLSRLVNVDAEILPENAVPEGPPVVYPYSAEKIFEDAQMSLPVFRARKLRMEAAQKDIKISKSLYFPEVSVFAHLNTNYSSAARLYTEIGSSLSETGGFITIDDKLHPVFAYEPQYLGSRMPFFDQFNNNLNSVVGATIRIPLLNGSRAKNEVALKKIQLRESEIELESTLLQLKESVDQAYLAMESAYRRYLILQDQVAAFQESFRVNDIRYQSGDSNMVEYIVSKNNMESAEVDLINARYEYWLRIKVLEYYRGNINSSK